MLDDEEGSIEWQALDAWSKYNPDWLLQNLGSDVRVSLTQMRELSIAGYKAAVITKLTGEVPTHEQ